MTNPAEVFMLQLSRASTRANRFLRQRGVRSDDRDDVIAAAMLWCWENRDNYSLTVTLDLWFLGAVRHAYRDWKRGEMRDGVTEIVENMGGKDDPEYNVMLRDAVATLGKNMDEVDRAIVSLTLDGKTQREASAELGIGLTVFKQRLSKMRDQLPQSAHVNTILRRAVTPATTSNYDGDETKTEQGRKESNPSSVDKAIEALDFPPQHGADCPPCWRCKWFEGYMPGNNRSVRMEIQEADVREAVRATEAEKVRIAGDVRNGNI